MLWSKSEHFDTEKKFKSVTLGFPKRIVTRRTDTENSHMPIEYNESVVDVTLKL